MSLAYIISLYNENNRQVFAKTYLNEDTGFYEVHYYDSVVKEEPPVGLFKFYSDAADAAGIWCRENE